MDKELEEQIGTLLGRGVGDRRVLEQIRRALLNGEVVSNAERSYVGSLVDQHAARPEPARSAPPSAPAKTAVAPEPERRPTGSKGNGAKLAAAAAGAAAVVAVVAVYAFMMAGPGPVEPAVVEPAVEEPEYGVQSNSEIYASGDFIEIGGTADPALSGTLSVRILDAAERVVWSEREIAVNEDGSYHTLALAGGPEWEPDTYTVEAIHHDTVYRTQFEFGG